MTARELKELCSLSSDMELKKREYKRMLTTRKANLKKKIKEIQALVLDLQLSGKVKNIEFSHLTIDGNPHLTLRYGKFEGICSTNGDVRLCMREYEKPDFFRGFESTEKYFKRQNKVLNLWLKELKSIK